MTMDEIPDPTGETDPAPRHKKILEAMKNRSADVLGQAKDAAAGAGGALKSAGSATAGAVKGAASGVGGAAKDAGEATSEATKGAASGAGGAFSGIGGRFKSAGEEGRRAARETENDLWAEYMHKTGRDRRDDT